MRSQWGEFTQERLAEIYGVTVQTIQYYLKYREAKGHAGGKVKHWHPDEVESLKVGVASGASIDQLAKLVGRSERAVVSKARKLGLSAA
jgi:hypothetical protein